MAVQGHLCRKLLLQSLSPVRRTPIVHELHTKISVLLRKGRNKHQPLSIHQGPFQRSL